jgi:4-hydroxybenzoate polyprenyltransferase
MDLKAIFKLIRPVNLLLMALTLILVRYCIFEPIFSQNGLEGLMPAWQFLFLIAATLFIAAGGYVINDVLDVEMDKINKPEKMIVGKRISDVTGKNLHINLTAVGVVFGLAFSWMAGNVFLGIFFVIIPTALFYYSFKYKYMPAVGNLVVALLSAMVVIIYWIFEFYHLKDQPDQFVEASRYFTLLNRFLLAYAAFALMASLMREIVKDAQDTEGDGRFGCRTLPIAIGIPSTRILVIALEIITVAGLAWFQLLLNRTGYQMVTYALVPTQVLLLAAVVMTIKANKKNDFARLSFLFKWIMLTGMLSLCATWFRNL